MRISGFELKTEYKGIQPTEKIINTGNCVVLTGGNGSGKTRLLNLIMAALSKPDDLKQIELYIADEQEDVRKYTKEDSIQIVNFSHYDAILQSAKAFSPYVIGMAKEVLKKCNYEETALNALLVIQDMAYGYSERFRDGVEFDNFRKFAGEWFRIELAKTTEGVRLFGFDPEDAGLSPGQQYLLRIAIACYFNNSHEDLAIVMDEPELHLHPEAMISMITKMREKFSCAQFWIATHSVELISYLLSAGEDTTVLCLNQRKINELRSDSTIILDSLLGNSDERLHIQQFYNSSDEYACLCFITECLKMPDVAEAKRKDPQQDLISELLHEEDTVVDYDAGKGRVIEQLAMESCRMAESIAYYAYNLPNYKDEAKCRTTIRKFTQKAEKYYDDIVSLKREVGESPHESGFLMITQNAAEKMFESYQRKEHEKRKYIVRYMIGKMALSKINVERIQAGVEAIRKDALDQIRDKRAKQIQSGDKQDYKEGLSFAFWLNQYANASLALEKL